jgi:CheY-like chemotaxis protein
VDIKILLVDDDRNRKDFVQGILKSSGYLVVKETDCENAFSLLTRESFDLILLDITLPDQSGFRVLEFLKEKNLTSKVILITGTKALENAIKSAIPGEQGYVTNPYSPHSLIEAIKHVLTDQSQPNHKLQIINVGDFIKSTPTGGLDMYASKKGLELITTVGTDLQDYTILIDLRDVKSHLSVSEIIELATGLVKYGETFRRKTALLARDDEDFDQATFFQTIAQNRGFDVKAFTVFEDAMNWLFSIT